MTIVWLSNILAPYTPQHVHVLRCIEAVYCYILSVLNLFSHYILVTNAGDILVERYESIMKESYSDLFKHAVRKLKQKLKSEKKYQRFISDMENRFSRVTLDTTDCGTVLRSIRKEERWDHLRYSNLFRILKRYVGKEMSERCHQYEQLHTGYNVVLLISAKLRGVEKIKEEYNNSLMVRVSPFTTPATKEHIRELWERVRLQFHLPKLEILLYDKTEGSLQLTWLIKADQETSVLIRSRLVQYMPHNEAFLQENNVTHIFFNCEKLYPVSCIYLCTVSILSCV